MTVVAAWVLATPIPVEPPLPVAAGGACADDGFADLDGTPRDPSGGLRLVSAGAVRFTPCSAGTLTITYEATEGVGAPARLLIVQGGRDLSPPPAAGMRVAARTLVAGETVMIAFANDVYEPPEDRNVFVRALRFVPAGR